MLKSIEFNNYKAFKSGKIEIKPITILLGANSVGKSSIIQLILMLQQTALSDNYKSALRLHGDYISLGENLNIFYRKKPNSILELKFKFSDSKFSNLLRKTYINELVESLTRNFELMVLINTANLRDSNIDLFLESDKQLRNIRHLFSKKGKDSHSKFTNIIGSIYSIADILNIKAKKDNKSIKSDKDNLDRTLNLQKEFFNYLISISKLNLEDLEITYKIINSQSEKYETLKVIHFSLKSSTQIIACIDLQINEQNNSYAKTTFTSDLLDENSILIQLFNSNIHKHIAFDSTLFNIIKPKITDNEFVFSNNSADLNYNKSIIDIMHDILSRSTECLKNIFSRDLINYVSPLRAHPKRYYFLDKSKINTSLDTLDGDSLTEILKENVILKEKVNNWLKNFGFTINVSVLENIIHKLKVIQNDLSLDITDVGFGLSQVLPVIVQGFLSCKNSITVIEQPEIHLHPKMQADLADLFIDIIKDKKRDRKFLLIETHSEYLLKRLRRRMSEKKNIQPEDVSINFINPDNCEKNIKIENRVISDDGHFEWPIDFYSGELLNDTIEFIKNQRY